MLTPYLHYKNHHLYFENTNLLPLAVKFGTPTYVYSKQALLDNLQQYKTSLQRKKNRICYAVKANSNLSILKLLCDHGASFDIVSKGELDRVLAVGAKAKQIIFSGVGKTINELEYAIENDIYCINIESFSELLKINTLGKKYNRKINIALRINPNINANTHPYIATGLNENKFGIHEETLAILLPQLKTLTHINVIGLACHIGSQQTALEPFIIAVKCLIKLANELKNYHISIQHINVGGGLGVAYPGENPPSINQFATELTQLFLDLPYELIIEPGRSLIADAGILLTQINYLKFSSRKNFAIIDAGMNDLIRPALYQAKHAILPIEEKQFRKVTYDIAGPICESSDIFLTNCELAIEENDILAITQTGAYGFSMSSNYNSRPRPLEILIDKQHFHIIRQRETIDYLLELEKIPSLC